MRKFYLFFWLWFTLTVVVNAQASIETFETEALGSKTFTDNGVVFNIISNESEFKVLKKTGFGWNGLVTDNAFIDNIGHITENASFSIKTTSNLFKANRFWVKVADNLMNLNVTGTLTITGKLSGVTKFSTTKTNGFFNSIGSTNGYTLIDMTNLNGQNYSNIVLDELRITTGGGFQYLAFDSFTWVKDSNIVLDSAPRITSTSFSGTVGVPFSEKIAATNNPTLFDVTDGFFPYGLVLNSTTGIFNGIPTIAGRFSARFIASNQYGVSPLQVITFNIAKANQTVNLQT
ncbi:putative Ig domain-containing protein [Chishuiella sp.]|uniref:putative Ig domain-containing protein n=1 Tax=Chishuiella sp. TaxID=1969467 RepID=UPI0028A83E3E|nr:putative Ig domain-containing protein [Chishuiella sp.]